MLELEDDDNEQKVSNVEIIDQQGNILRNAKITTKDVYKLNEGEKILVHVDDRYQLIKDAVHDSQILYTSRKNNRLGSFKIFNQKYRAMKYRTTYKLSELVTSRLDETINIGVDEKLSEIGKKARGEKLHTHRTGAHKRSLGFVEIFEIQHTGADGSYVEDASRNLVVKANKEISRKISELGCPKEEIDNEKRDAIDRDVWIDLAGPEGEVLGYGAGVTKSNVTNFNNELRKMRGENYMNSNYVYKLLVQTKSQNSVIESQNRTIASLNKTVETLTKTIEPQNEKLALQDEKLKAQTKKVEELEKAVGGFRDELKLFQKAYVAHPICFF
ncbi:ribose 5-phosphate isomerase A [Tanacetum coccineum]